MKNISNLIESDLADAYQIEKISHLIPWTEQTFYSNQGARYLNKKIELDTQMVGFCICQMVADEATLFNIAIHPDFRQRGLARLLLNALIDQLTVHNIASLWLEVRASNIAAINLYNQLGFNEITLRKDYYPALNGQKEDAIIMAYTLSM